MAFDPLDAIVGRALCVTPDRAVVTIDEEDLDITYGHWRLRTSLDNVAAAEVTGPYQRWKVGGPPRLSMRDRGVTFATTTERGVCIRFVRPVPAALPFGILEHTAATVTPADPFGLVAALRFRGFGE